MTLDEALVAASIGRRMKLKSRKQLYDLLRNSLRRRKVSTRGLSVFAAHLFLRWKRWDVKEFGDYEISVWALRFVDKLETP